MQVFGVQRMLLAYCATSLIYLSLPSVGTPDSENRTSLLDYFLKLVKFGMGAPLLMFWVLLDCQNRTPSQHKLLI